VETIVSQLDKAFRAAIRAAFGMDADPLIGLSQNDKFGDYQSNAAMGFAKKIAEQTGQTTNPRAVAEQIKAKLELGEMAQEISIAGPGFINVRLSPTWLASQLQTIANDPRLGVSAAADPQTVVVDYSGPNIAKQMHVGHLRSTIIGDAISRVLAFQGHNVIRQNHIGDWGTQFGRVVLAMWYAAMAEHFHETELLQSKAAAMRDPTNRERVVHEVAEIHRNYILQDPKGKDFETYLERVKLDLSRLESLYTFVSTLTEHPAAAHEWIPRDQENRRLDELPRLVTTYIQNPDIESNAQEKLAWRQACEITLETCNDIYRRLEVQLADQAIQPEPIVRGESFYYFHDNLIAKVVDELLRKQIATRSEGAVVVIVPGFEAPLLIQKSDGSYLYGTTDLAALKFRLQELHANHVIYTHDSRQSQHFSQVFWTARQAGWAEQVELDFAAFGTMLGEDGKPFKTRSGDTVKLKDLLQESEDRALATVSEKNPTLPEALRQQIAHAVGIGAVKYADLSKDRVSDYVFSWDRMLALDGNTAPYIQYAHTRVKGIFRKAGGNPDPSAAIELSSPYELTLAKHILRFGEVLAVVTRELKPHHLCSYLYELATKFSGFFENCPVIQSEEPIRSSRLALANLTARTLEIGLDLLGIEHPNEM